LSALFLKIIQTKFSSKLFIEKYNEKSFEKKLKIRKQKKGNKKVSVRISFGVLLKGK
jgi:hypothetical protein